MEEVFKKEKLDELKKDVIFEKNPIKKFMMSKKMEALEDDLQKENMKDRMEK